MSGLTLVILVALIMFVATAIVLTQDDEDRPLADGAFLPDGTDENHSPNGDATSGSVAYTTGLDENLNNGDADATSPDHQEADVQTAPTPWTVPSDEFARRAEPEPTGSGTRILDDHAVDTGSDTERLLHDKCDEKG